MRHPLERVEAAVAYCEDSNPCSIRVSSVAQGSLASVLSGTSVRSVAKEQARASVPHFLAKPKVRPLPTELQIGSLRSRNDRIEHQLAQTPERPRVGRRNRVARLHPARIPFRTTALISVSPRTREHSLAIDCVRSPVRRQESLIPSWTSLESEHLTSLNSISIDASRTSLNFHQDTRLDHPAEVVLHLNRRAASGDEDAKLHIDRERILGQVRRG